MKCRIVSALLLALAMSPAFAAKVYVDYDQNFDAHDVKTFEWQTTPETSLEQRAPMLHKRIVGAVQLYLTAAGLTQTPEDPDVLVTYHVNTESELRLNTSYYSYGYPTGWYGNPYYGSVSVGVSTARRSTPTRPAHW